MDEQRLERQLDNNIFIDGVKVFVNRPKFERGKVVNTREKGTSIRGEGDIPQVYKDGNGDKAVMTRRKMAIHVDESEAEKKMEEHKQQLAPKPALEPVSDFLELEEINEEAEDDKEEETPIKEKEK